MAIAIHYAARSDIGLGRYRNNQDSGYAGPHLLVVADGMGGAAGGDVASSTVIGELVPLDADGPGPDAERDLHRAVIRANTAMADLVAGEPSLQGMGSTCTAILRSGSRLVIAHVGDSRAYVLSESRLNQVTHDHTFVQRLIDSNQITEEEAERHPQRSVILRVVGHLEPDDVDMLVATPQVGQRWLLCSDGLPRVVSNDTIQEALAAGKTPEATAEDLVQLALRAGGPDNITVIVADVVDPSARPPLTPQVVGAAATVKNKPTIARSGPAARAAALTAATRDEDEADDGEGKEQASGAGASSAEKGPRRRRRLITGLLVSIVLLALMVLGAQRWIQSQYFVGAYEGNVAVYRGLNTQIGPITLNRLMERTNLPLTQISEYQQRSAQEGFPSGSRADAEATVAQLWKESPLCRVEGSTPGGPPSEQPAPTAPTGPSATTAPAPGAQPSPGGQAGPDAQASPTATGSDAAGGPDTSLSPNASDTITSTPNPSPRPTECPTP